MELEKNPKKQSAYDIFVWMIFVDIILIFLAVVFYNGNFLFWEYPLSTSGVAYTYVESNSNLISMCLFSMAMIFSALSLSKFGLYLLRQSAEKHRVGKLAVGFVGSIGFVITAFSPDDVRHSAHILGLALAVTAVWLTAFFYVAEIGGKVATRAFVAAELLLNLPLFAYIQAYFIKFDPSSYNFQKISLSTICVVLLWSSYQSGKSLPSIQNQLH